MLYLLRLQPLGVAALGCPSAAVCYGSSAKLECPDDITPPQPWRIYRACLHRIIAAACGPRGEGPPSSVCYCPGRPSS
ncbi:hypothetical protein AAT19DRAFT_15487 [Rhodotorula toruloides]|uniref:Uncharacterized protein n=1 Tax=Rhodotorula toruloides TaxID=5286 RepID=A0A2T0A7E2_RHOTO|nr:hypothetical protein AAT19DRAFT_15487 [Rhodotorula toruloides]